MNHQINRFNGLDRSLLVKHLVIKDVHNSWLYCFTNTVELGTRVSLSHCQPYVSTHNLNQIKSSKEPKWVCFKFFCSLIGYNNLLFIFYSLLFYQMQKLKIISDHYHRL